MKTPPNSYKSVAQDTASSQEDPQKPWNAEERSFYEEYGWALYPFPTFAETLVHLQTEIARLDRFPEDWRRREIASNIYLLASAVLHSTDEYIRGKTIRIPGKIGANPLLRSVSRINDFAFNNSLSLGRKTAFKLRENWHEALHDFLCELVRESEDEQPDFMSAAEQLAGLADAHWPQELSSSHIVVPSPFRRLDLTQQDVVRLGHMLADAMRDHEQKLLLVGLRTSGSYFAPLIRAVLHKRGFDHVDFLTFEPSKGPGRWERIALQNYARAGYAAIIVDDPPHTGNTIFSTFERLRKLGFAPDACKALVPSHPAKPNWHKPLPAEKFIALPPQEWQKNALLREGPDREVLRRYFKLTPSVSISGTDCSSAAELQAQLQGSSAEARMQRLKRIFRIRITRANGQTSIRHVLGKSVGWGWLGYHAYLSGQNLSGFVPPVISLRNGILYSEFFPQSEADSESKSGRQAFLDRIGDYVAARVRSLPLDTFSSHTADRHRHNSGSRLIEKAISRNYGRFPNDILIRARIGRKLQPLFETVPTLIDGAMQRSEWIFNKGRALKTDFEHHGLGKGPVNLVDPAFDLADAMLSFELSPSEQQALLARYIDKSRDTNVAERMYINKLAAGLWTMNEAQSRILAGSSDPAVAQAQHRQFMSAWHFLTVETAQACRHYFNPQPPEEWRGPMVVLDIDGVIDLRYMGFPATTMAGAKALALLVANGMSVVVNTARSAAEVQEYCRAYGLAGAVGEHGGYMWDAISGRDQVLINSEESRQLEILREKLRAIPGIFLDDRHICSIRAFTYTGWPKEISGQILRSLRVAEVGDGAVLPLPAAMINTLMTELGLDLLSVHHTTIDTTITARRVNKGTGLVSIRDWVLDAQTETIAVGDQKPDLFMFASASRSFAPGHISCRNQAKLLGCKIAERPFQRGLYDIALEIVKSCRPEPVKIPQLSDNLPPGIRLLAQAMDAADKSALRKAIAVLSSPDIFSILIR